MAEPGGQGGASPPPDFGRSENGGGSAGALHYYSPPQIFRPSAIPGYTTKGQLISEGLFGFFNSPNERKISAPVG